MENKDQIILKLNESQFSFKEMPQMKVLDLTIPLSIVQEIIEDFDPSLDRGITGVCKNIERKDDNVFILSGIKFSKTDSWGEPIDENAINCSFFQMNQMDCGNEK